MTLICTILLAASPAAGYQATFTSLISVSEEYTDNYLLTDDNKEHEYITTISPAFTAQILGKSIGAEISYAPSYAFYDRFNENDTLRQNAQFSGWAEIAKDTRLDVGDSFLYTEEPIAEIEEEDTTIRRSREPYYTNSANLGLTYQFGESDSINLGYVHSLLENEDPNVEDNERHNPFFGLTYGFTPQWGIEIRSSYTRGEFDTSDDFDNWNGSVSLIYSFTNHYEGIFRYAYTYMVYQGESENYQIYDPSIGINYTIDENTNLSLSIGYFLQDWEESEDDSQMSVNSNLVKSLPFRRGIITITGSSGYEESYFGAENLGLNRFYEAGGSTTYQVSNYVSINIFGSYRNNKYIVIEPEREDIITTGGLRLTIQPLLWISIGLNYTYRSVDSTLNENDYEENRGLIRVTLSPSLPYRFAQ